MKRKILNYFLAFLTLLVSFLAWFSVEQAINVANSSTWGMPMFWFSFFFISLSLGLVLIKRLVLVELIAGAAFLSSWFFVFSAEGRWLHLLMIIISFLFVSWGISRIRRDLKLNIKVDLWKTLRMGSTFFIFSISLIVSSQYYFETKTANIESVWPKFKIGALSDKLTAKIISSVNPDFKDLQSDGITVNQFILENQKNQFKDIGGLEQITGQAGESVWEITEQLGLAEGRKNLSEMVGMELTGQEKIADVFSGIVNNKINNFVAPNHFSSNENIPLLRLLLAFALFLMVMSLGSMLSIFLLPLVKFIFFLLVKFDLVKILKIQKEVEEIE